MESNKKNSQIPKPVQLSEASPSSVKCPDALGFGFEEKNEKQIKKEEKGKFGKTVEGAEKLSLGISVVVAILMGIGVGILLKKWTGFYWTLWLGVFWGVAAAVLNIKKEYDKLKKDFDKVANSPKYKNYQLNTKDEEDEDLEIYEK